MEYGATGIKEGSANVSVDKLHLYGAVATTSFSQSLGPYERNM